MLSERRIKVLIADDDDTRRYIVREALSKTHYWTQDANRLSDHSLVLNENDQTPSVEQQLKAHFFHIAIVDLSLVKDDDTDRSGFAVLAAIQRRQEGTQCIVMSQYGKDTDVARAWLDLGASSYLSKRNYSPAALHELVASAEQKAKQQMNAALNTKLPYQYLIGEPSPSDVGKVLNVSSSVEITSLVEEALRPYFPFDQRNRSMALENLFIDDTQHPVFAITLWSRYLGAAVRLRIGSREACQLLATNSRISGKQEKVDFLVSEINHKDRLIGFVEYLPSIAIDELLVPPTEANY